MSLYAILSENLQAVIEVTEIADHTVLEWRRIGNPKASRVRDVLEGQKPVATNDQKLVQSGWVIADLTATRTWEIVDRPANERDARGRETVIRNAIADLKLIRDSSGTLTAAQLSNAVRAISKALVALIEELRP